MEIKKSQWTTDGDTFAVNMPLSKIDKERRLVSGWASLDNTDLQGDIVLAEASERAFAKFRGNIREMHQPIAAGRMVAWKTDKYYDVESGKEYNGIFVTAHISKGAQSTWDKVLDGTLSMFSIKGPIEDSEMEFSKERGGAVRIVKDYSLEELSLVDSGGNQFASVVSFQKSVDGEVTATGLITETNSENVFYCEKDGVAKTSNDDAVECADGHKMTNIGWIEYADGERGSKIAEVVQKYQSQQETATNEGGVDVADETKTPEEGSPVPAEVKVDEQGKAENEVTSSVENDEAGVAKTEAAGEGEAVEKAADVSEVAEEEVDLTKLFGDLKTAVETGLSDNAKTATEAIEAVKKDIEGEIAKLAEKHEELTKNLGSVKQNLETMEKRLGGFEEGTAIKKSGDLGGSTEETVEKSSDSVWGGRFLGITDL